MPTSSASLRHPTAQKDSLQHAHRQQSSYGTSFHAGLAPAASIAAVNNGANPHVIFQNIQELASKRISTLDYLRKAYALTP